MKTRAIEYICVSYLCVCVCVCVCVFVWCVYVCVCVVCVCVCVCVCVHKYIIVTDSYSCYLFHGSNLLRNYHSTFMFNSLQMEWTQLEF